MEAAAVVVSFVGLASPVAQGLKFLYDFTTDIKDCPKDVHEMRTDLELVEGLITQVIRQCNERDKRLRESAALARAIGHAQKSVQDLKQELSAYLAKGGPNGKVKRLMFAAKLSRTQKLRASLIRTKTIMSDFKNQLQSDLLYDIRDTSEEVLRSVEMTNTNLETYDRNFPKVTPQSEVQPQTTNNSKGRVETSDQLASGTSSKGLTDIEIMANKLEHIEGLLAETRISSSPTSIPSTPTLSREASDISVMSSSQETTASSISSSRSIPRSEPQNT